MKFNRLLTDSTHLNAKIFLSNIFFKSFLLVFSVTYKKPLFANCASSIWVTLSKKSNCDSLVKMKMCDFCNKFTII